MKRYILVIGILALFVIFMMPMAAAAPADQRMRTDVYLLSGCDNPGDWSSECTGIVNAPVGTFTMGALYHSDDCGTEPDNMFKRIYSLRGLPPNTPYWIVLFDQPGGGINGRFSGEDYVIQLSTHTDAKGWLKMTHPMCDYGKRSFFKTELESGQYWVGLIPSFGDT